MKLDTNAVIEQIGEIGTYSDLYKREDFRELSASFLSNEKAKTAMINLGEEVAKRYAAVHMMGFRNEEEVMELVSTKQFASPFLFFVYLGFLLGKQESGLDALEKMFNGPDKLVDKPSVGL